LSQTYEFWEDYEVLAVETPENIELRLPLAGFGPRLLAQVIDSLISGVVSLVILILAVAALWTQVDWETGAGFIQAFMVAMVVSMLSWIVYYTVFEIIWNGQTPGKRVTGIRVVKRGGLPLQPRDVVLRNLVRLIDYFPSHGLTGLVSFFATSNQQRLGDLVADTVVIKEFAQQLPFSWVGGMAGSGSGPGLTPRLSYVAGNYLARAQGFDMQVRLDMTSRIITSLGYDPKPMNLREREEYISSVLSWQASGGGQ